MKRRIFALLFALLMVATCLSLAGCAKEAIAKLWEDMEKTGKFEIEIKVEALVAAVGFSFPATTIVNDINKSKVTTGLVEQYFEKTETEFITYTKSIIGNSYVKTSTPITDVGVEVEIDKQYVLDNEMFEELFDEENYEYNSKEKQFELKEGVKIKIVELELDQVIMKVDGDSCSVSATSVYDSVSVTVTITVSEVGSATVTLPIVD